MNKKIIWVSVLAVALLVIGFTIWSNIRLRHKIEILNKKYAEAVKVGVKKKAPARP